MSIPAANRAPSAIPGYAAELWSRPGVATRTTQLFLLFALPLHACEQLFIVAPKLYLVPLSHTLEQVVIALGLVCLLTGGLVARRALPQRTTVAYALALSAAMLVTAAYARFVAFDGPPWQHVLAAVPAWIAAVALGFSVVGACSTAKAWLQLADGTWLWLHPFAPITYVAAMAATTVATTALGPLRASLALAGGLLTAAWLLYRSVEHRPRSRHELRAISGAFLLLSLLALYTERLCPLALVLRNLHPLVYTTQTDKIRLEVTSGQEGLHYFVDGELRFSSLDEKRWAQTISLPALARLAAPKRALVLSLGEGLIERELLAFTPELAIVSVMRDARVAEAARRQWFLRRLTRGSMNSPRVTRVERDPAVFAQALTDERFDLIIVDLPDPVGPREHKYYTRRFYAQLRAHLDSSGILAVQAASARRSPRAFAIIGETLRAAGLNATPMVVPLMTRGEWSLYLATNGPLPGVIAEERYRETFPGSLEPQLMNLWPDTLPPKDFVAKPNTQHDALLMEWFDYETTHSARD